MDCPVGHTECTANMSPAAPEYEMGKVISTQLGMQDVLVRYVTTDGDAKVDDTMRALHPLWKLSLQRKDKSCLLMKFFSRGMDACGHFSAIFTSLRKRSLNNGVVKLSNF